MSDVGVLINLEDETVEQSRVVLDYTSRDFQSIRAQLIGLAKGLMPEWDTSGEAPDFGTLLLELFSYMGDVMHFYIDRTASEAFLGTAIRRQSILYIADMLGYTPIGQQAASVELLFSLDPNLAEEPVTLPKGTRIYNETDNADNLIMFELERSVTLNPGDGITAGQDAVAGFASEGLTVSAMLLGVSKGTPNTEFVIPDKGVIFGSISVTTLEGNQTVDWIYVSDLSLSRPTQAAFTTFTDDIELTHIVFGDNAAGRIPPTQAQIFATYRYGVGVEANSIEPNKINTIANVTGVEMAGVTVRNPESPVGGTDPESIESMRYSIPRAAGALKSRAITLNDYADLAMQVPGVAKSVAHGTVYTAVHVKIAPVGGQANDEYMNRLCNSVEAYMADKVIVGSKVYAEPRDVDLLWQDIYVWAWVHVIPTFNRSSVRGQVEAVIRQLLSFDAVDFGYRVSKGQIYRAMLAVQGVEYAELVWLNISEPTEADINPDGGTNTPLFSTTWEYSNNHSMADPGTEHYRVDNDFTPAQLAFDIIGSQGINRYDQLKSLKAGDHIVMRPVENVASWHSLLVTAVPTDNTSWIQVAVSVLDVSDTYIQPGVNDLVLFDFYRFVPDPITRPDVSDIITDELLIPRIEPTEVVEPEDKFSRLPLNTTEAERTHDGLWVVADGGTPNS